MIVVCVVIWLVVKEEFGLEICDRFDVFVEGNVGLNRFCVVECFFEWFLSSGEFVVVLDFFLEGVLLLG